jgi:hypothetical protein
MPHPHAIFKNGTCVAAVFAEGENGGKGWRVTLHRRFLEGKKWQHTDSFGVDDIPKAIIALQKAYDYLTTNFWNKEERDLPLDFNSTI